AFLDLGRDVADRPGHDAFLAAAERLRAVDLEAVRDVLVEPFGRGPVVDRGVGGADDSEGLAGVLANDRVRPDLLATDGLQAFQPDAPIHAVRLEGLGRAGVSGELAKAVESGTLTHVDPAS